MDGVKALGGVCRGTAAEAQADAFAAAPPQAAGPDGSVVINLFTGQAPFGPFCTGTDFDGNPSGCGSYSTGYYRQRNTPDPNGNCGWSGWCTESSLWVDVTLSPCEYKGGFEYWGPILSAFFLAGVALLLARMIAGIFKRETV